MSVFRSLSPVSLLAPVLFLASCGPPRLPIYLYAVKGDEAATVQQVKGVATMYGPYRGTVTLTWPDGETGTGQYSGIANFSTSTTTYRGGGSSSTYGTVGPRSYSGSIYGRNGVTDYSGTLGTSTVMLNTYQSVYGRSFTRSLAPGAVPIQGIVITDRGRRVEFMGAAGSGSNNGSGVATDNRGNTYKVIF